MAPEFGEAPTSGKWSLEKIKQVFARGTSAVLCPGCSNTGVHLCERRVTMGWENLPRPFGLRITKRGRSIAKLGHSSLSTSSISIREHVDHHHARTRRGRPRDTARSWLGDTNDIGPRLGASALKSCSNRLSATSAGQRPVELTAAF